jgi:hypothetical protein
VTVHSTASTWGVILCAKENPPKLLGAIRDAQYRPDISEHIVLSRIVLAQTSDEPDRTAYCIGGSVSCAAPEWLLRSKASRQDHIVKSYYLCCAISAR